MAVKFSPAPTAHSMQKVIKEDSAMVISLSAQELDSAGDAFFGGYDEESKNGTPQVMKPPVYPRRLWSIAETNSIIPQCAETMQINVAATGYDLVDGDGETVEEGKFADLIGFLDRPHWNASLTDVLKAFVYEREVIGYSAIEFLPNIAGEIVAFKHHSMLNTRLIRLDEPVQVQREIRRGKKVEKFNVNERERRYVERINNKNIFYREFGSSRKLNKHTGMWESADSPVEKADEATELYVSGIRPDAKSPYFLPRWWNNIPSALGGRKAEEENLVLFDNQGIPAGIIFVEGGQAAANTSRDLNAMLAGNKSNRLIVVPVESTSGSMDSTSKATVKVERFGSATNKDAMNKGYLDETEERLRRSWRIPPLFLGKAADYNFATAKTAYMVAEAQVFAPERTSTIDEMMNRLLSRKGITDIYYRSRPITLTDAEQKLKALYDFKDMAEGETVISEVNTTAGTALKYKEPPPPPEPIAPGAAPGEAPGAPGRAPPEKLKAMADKFAAGAVGTAKKEDQTAEIRSLHPDDQTLFEFLVSSQLLYSPQEVVQHEHA